MANDYFQFKHFIVYQDKCSMKVCTDACILGAWTAKHVITKKILVNRCLDIGTGSGLLSLMLAQKTNAFIDAVEIDKDAFKQATGNFSRSLWSERLRVFHADIKYFNPGVKYNFIISNPPFYQDNLLSPLIIRNIAKHNEALKLDELIIAIKNNLSVNGSFAVLLPYYRIKYFENIASEHNFFLQAKLLIKQTQEHNYFRGILLYNQTNNTPVINELIIKENNNYSDDFTLLLKDYYLER
jgi:tRNA1Val (adenine37-N6)-methyltransferase